MSRATALPGQVAVGLAASWVKELSEPRLQSVVERLLPPTPEQKLDVGADPAGHPENMPPAVLVDRTVRALGHRGLSAAQRVRVQRVIHYSTGSGLGVAYGAAVRRWPLARSGRGALAGFAIYAGSHGSLLAALRVQRPPWRLAPAAVIWELASHLVFGIALEAGRCTLGER